MIILTAWFIHGAAKSMPQIDGEWREDNAGRNKGMSGRVEGWERMRLE